jgi:hypothetical protein
MAKQLIEFILSSKKTNTNVIHCMNIADTLGRKRLTGTDRVIKIARSPWKSRPETAASERPGKRYIKTELTNVVKPY